MAILDNRTKLSGFETGDTVTAPDDLSGAAGGTADTEIFIEGVRSYGYYSGSTRDGLLYDHGSAQDWSSNTFYIWVNCGVAGLLNTKAAGGLAVRFCGATVTDWFEVYVAGSDDYPSAVSGGWVMLVVDVEKAKTASDAVNGTPPATTAIRYVGVSTQTTAMPRMADNTWVDAMWRLPAATPGILVEAQNTGSVDWDFDDIVSTAEASSWGTAKTGPGGSVQLNTPVRYGANDAVTHGFSDTNKTILWEDWDVDASFYGLEVIGGSGAQSFELGIKTGTGDAATGAQGCVIQAAAAGQRWFFTADDANVDVCNVYGCTFNHADDLQIGSATVSFVSTLLVDCTAATVSNAEILRCSIIDANTLDDVAFMITDDLTDVVFCDFSFSDGHAIELTTPRVASQASKGNLFTGYGATTSTDAAVFNNTAGAVTINVSDLGDSPTYKDGASASTIVDSPVSYTLTNLVAASEVRIYRLSDGVELDGIESSGTSFVFNYNYVSDTDTKVIIHRTDYEWQRINVTMGNSNVSQQVIQRPDLNFENN